MERPPHSMVPKLKTLRRHRVGEIGILVAAACLILLTWIGTFSAMKAERRAVRSEVEAGAREEALASWRGAAVMLNDPSVDLFMTDAAGVVRESTNPQAAGLDLSGRAFFAREARRTADDGGIGIDRTGRGLFADQWSVGFEPGQAMRASDAWLWGAVAFAAGTTLFLLLIAALLLRDRRQARLRERRMAQDRDAIESAYAELKRAKQQADAKSAQLEATFASLSDGVSLLDRDMRLIQWNARFCELTGLAAAELRVGMPFADVLRRKAVNGELGPGDPDAEVARRMDLLSEVQGLTVTERVRPDGTAIELRRAPLPCGGFVTVYRDITMRKQAEATEKLARAAAETLADEKSRFAAIVSHEIRTPLNTLLNSIEILGQSGLSVEDRAIAGLARQAGEALHVLLDDILELSKLDAGRFTLRPCWFGIEALLAGVRDLLRGQAAQRGIVFRLDIASDVPKLIYSDPARLRQVLMNFVSNAVKFSEPGEVTIAAFLDGAHCLRIAVSDPGPQIAEVNRALLFRAFSRVEQAGGQGEPGSGLGLAICRRLMTIAGGDSGYEACANGGNAFWLTLPISSPSGSGSGDALLDASPLPVLPRARVLVVDDVRGNQAVAVRLLEQAGHTVDVAGSGADAVVAASRASYDLILLDLHMPGLDGFETAERLRALDSVAGATPIVALTAQADAGTRSRCHAVGMQDVLEKPLTPRALLDAVGHWVWGGAAADPDLLPVPGGCRSVPELSPARLASLRGTIPDVELGRMFDGCFSDLAGKLPSLGTALTDEDSRDAAGLLHAMSGVAASYGLQALHDRLRALQSSLAAGESIDGPAACATIGNDLARTRSAAREMFASEPAM